MVAWLVWRAHQLDAQAAIVCHNVLPHERGRMDASLTRLALARADRLIVHSQADFVRARTLMPQAKVKVAAFPTYGAVLDATPWTREQARAELGLQGRVLLFFGLVRPYKGLLDLLDALPRVLTELEITLLVVGEIWGEKEVYARRLSQLGIATHVRFIDRYVDNQEAAMYFAAADLVVLPYREATGSAVLQLAFAAGVPVVATRAGSIADAVDEGETGFLVDVGDIEGLSQGILRFFKEDRAVAFRTAIERNRVRFGWDAVLEAILDL
jgi:glycosyltransferase involved in cell wall biosynthesis